MQMVNKDIPLNLQKKKNRFTVVFFVNRIFRSEILVMIEIFPTQTYKICIVSSDF